MSYRIWNTTKKAKPVNAKEKMGYMFHMIGTLVGPNRSITITDDQFAKYTSRLTELQAADAIRIEPLSTVTKEQVADLAQQVAHEKKVASERAMEKATSNGKASMTGFESKPRASEQPGFDPNNDDDDLPFANSVDSDTMAIENNSHTDSFTVLAKNTGGVGKKSRGR